MLITLPIIGWFVAVWLSSALLGGWMGSGSWNEFISFFHKDPFALWWPSVFGAIFLFVAFIVGIIGFAAGGVAGVAFGVSLVNPLRSGIAPIEFLSLYGALLAEGLSIFFAIGKFFKLSIADANTTIFS